MKWIAKMADIIVIPAHLPMFVQHRLPQLSNIIFFVFLWVHFMAPVDETGIGTILTFTEEIKCLGNKKQTIIEIRKC